MLAAGASPEPRGSTEEAEQEHAVMPFRSCASQAGKEAGQVIDLLLTPIILLKLC